MNLIHLDDSDRNKAPSKYGRTVYQNVMKLLNDAAPFDGHKELLLSTYAIALLKKYFEDEGVNLDNLTSLNGIPVKEIDNTVAQNHALASIGIQIT